MIDEAHATALHEAAMAFAHEATLTRDVAESERLSRLALENERAAAEMLDQEYREEPTRSILYRSAATLARDCREYGEAERLIARGLSGFPPPDVAEELRELWDLVHFDRHLALDGIVLDPEDFVFTVAGNDVAPGVAGEGFLSRFRVAQRLFHKIAQHAMDIREKTKSLFRKESSDAFKFYLMVASKASFAVTIKVGRNRQMSLIAEPDEIGSIIDEMIDCVDIFQNSSDAEFTRKIPDESYRTDLRQLLDQLAPDGKDVGFVGVARRRDGEEKKASITRRRGLPLVEALELEEGRRLKQSKKIFRGRLLYANDVAKSAKIILVEGNGEKHDVLVPKGTMEEIVRPLWGKDVIARVEWRSARTKIPRLAEIYEDR